MDEFWKQYNYFFLFLAAVSSLIFPSFSVTSILPQSRYENNSCNVCASVAYAQNDGSPEGINSNNLSQMWVDKTSGVRINFSYSPTKPLVDSTTQLKFNVRDLRGGSSNLKDVIAHVSITTNSSGQERTFKFNNITAPNGDFSLKYIFPDYGTYQIITTIRSNTSAVALASFPITIPVQNVSTFNNPALIIGIIIIVVGIVALAVIFIKVKK